MGGLEDLGRASYTIKGMDRVLARSGRRLAEEKDEVQGTVG